MGKKIHLFDPAEEIFKQEQEALRMATTANPFGELLSNPAKELLKQQETLRMATTANPLGELPEKIFKDLLKPINYLEEQVKAMNIAALGKDYLVVFLK